MSHEAEDDFGDNKGHEFTTRPPQHFDIPCPDLYAGELRAMSRLLETISRHLACTALRRVDMIAACCDTTAEIDKIITGISQCIKILDDHNLHQEQSSVTIDRAITVMRGLISHLTDISQRLQQVVLSHRVQ